MGVTGLVFELEALKAKFKGAFSRSYCCYGNLLLHKINSNLFTDNWAFCWYLDFGINRSRVVITTHQTLKSWKVLETVFSHLKSVCCFLFWSPLSGACYTCETEWVLGYDLTHPGVLSRGQPQNKQSWMQILLWSDNRNNSRKQYLRNARMR